MIWVEFTINSEVCIFSFSVGDGECFIRYLGPLGGVHAVHQYCGAFCGQHELPSSPAVRVHTAGTGRLPGGQKNKNTYTHTELDFFKPLEVSDLLL